MSDLTPMAKDVLQQIADGEEHQIGKHYWFSALSLCRRGLANTRATGSAYYVTITEAGRKALTS